jgi:hypothetical protein
MNKHDISIYMNKHHYVLTGVEFKHLIPVTAKSIYMHISVSMYTYIYVYTRTYIYT